MHQNLRKGRGEILDGPIISPLVSLGWPIVLSNIFQTIYNFADTLWVSRLGKHSVAATTLASARLIIIV